MNGEVVVEGLLFGYGVGVGGLLCVRMIMKGGKVGSVRKEFDE